MDATDMAYAKMEPSGPTSHGERKSRHTAVEEEVSGNKPFPNVQEQDSSDMDDEVIELPSPVEADAVEEMIGVSMSPIQTRMKARQTPAAEKTKVMSEAEGYFDVSPDRDAETDGVYLADATPRKPPSAEAKGEEDVTKQDKHEDDHKDETKRRRRTSMTLSFLKGSLGNRRRAGTGDSLSSHNFKKFLPDLPSFTKRVAPVPSSKTSPTEAHPRSYHTKAATSDPNSPRPGPDGRAINQPSLETSSSKDWQEDALADLEDVQTANSFVYSARHPPSIRRSSSDQSLYVRSLSRASTLEHRPHYEHIHSQVNSRFKAIKDSLQDSSSRLLSMPNFNIAEFRTEWHPRQFLQDASPQRTRSGSDIALVQQVNRGAQIKPKQASLPAGTAYPLLKKATSQLTGDIVVMGGYRGSVLRSAKPPHRQLWFPMKVGLNIRKVDLEVGLTPEDEERMEETVIASESLSHIGPVDICRRLLQKLRKCDTAQRGELRVWDYGYDWRLSPHFLSRKLIQFLEGLPCNAPDVPREKRGAWVVAHSLGGLITRHAVNQRPELFAGVLYAGTPQHCVNILGPLRNGDEVLLSTRVLTAQVNFSIRTSFVFLPEDGRCFINKDTKEDYPIDFFNVKTWDEYRLSPCITEPLLPFGIEGKKGLIDSLPTSLPSLPKLALGKRLSGMRGNIKEDKESSEHSTVQPRREQEQVKHAPKGGHEVASEPEEPAIHDPPGVDNVVGPTSAPKPSKIRPASAGICTIPRSEAIGYLRRTLDDCLRFKHELAFNKEHQANNIYPPFAVLYAKSVPTVYGARVASREHIKCWDAYDDLAFAAGDGVCLASAAMLPAGYRIIKDGLVKTDRGHVGLLGDLEGVGQCLQALINGRKAGVGLGNGKSADGY